jgi:hypothetical protein
MENVGNNEQKKMVWLTLSTKDEVQLTLSDERLSKIYKAIFDGCPLLVFEQEGISVNPAHIVKIFVSE